MLRCGVLWCDVLQHVDVQHFVHGHAGGERLTCQNPPMCCSQNNAKGDACAPVMRCSGSRCPRGRPVRESFGLTGGDKSSKHGDYHVHTDRSKK